MGQQVNMKEKMRLSPIFHFGCLLWLGQEEVCTLVKQGMQ